jgi:glutathione S-transferase
MADIILHHYPASPFSEKVRLILGFKGLAWKSVIVPSIAPKPDVVALTGGYRKTPFLQIGKDVYCDTALIADVLEALQPEPSLRGASHPELAVTFAQWADSTLFWAAMGYNFQPKGAAGFFDGLPPEAAAAFAKDRASMSAGMPRLRPGDATTAYRVYLQRLEGMLQEQAFLFGRVPCIADFSAYHSLWFTRTCTPALVGIFEPFPAVTGWMERMAAIGHGRIEKLKSQQAIELCANTPAPAPVDTTDFLDDHGITLGTLVSVTAESFGQEPTVGELVAATAQRFTLRRTDERAGLVHVHFPRIGFVLRKAEH